MKGNDFQAQIDKIKFKKRMDDINRVSQDLEESFVDHNQQFVHQVSIFIEDCHWYSIELEKLKIGEGYQMYKLGQLDKDLS